MMIMSSPIRSLFAPAFQFILALASGFLLLAPATVHAANPPIAYDGATATASLAPGLWNFYEVVVPANSEGFKVVLSTSGPSDPDLYLRENLDPTTGAYTLRSLDSDVDTLLLTTTNVADRTFQIGVYLPAGETLPTDYTLQTFGDYLDATLTWDPGTVLSGSSLYSAPNPTGGTYAFKIITEAPDLAVWRAVLSVSTGEADLYARQNSFPTTATFTESSTNTGSDGFTRYLSNTSGAGQVWYFRVETAPGSAFDIFAGDIYVEDLGPLAEDLSSSSGLVTIPPEGARFFKNTVPTDTIGWRLWLQDAAGTSTWDHPFYVREGLAPFHSITSYYDHTRTGQGLLVPDYIDPGGGKTFFTGVWGDYGDSFQLESRKHLATDITHGNNHPITPGDGFRYQTFRVPVPVDQIAWQVAIDPTSGNPDLAIRQGAVPNEYANDAFSELDSLSVADSVTVVPPDLVSGNWYVTLYSDAAYSGLLTNGEPEITPIDYATANYDPLNPSNSFYSVVNNDPNRTGWRYFVVSNVGPPQLGSLAWLLELENQVPGTEIAIRRNFVPGRWNYRNNSTTVSQTNRQDKTSTGGFLQDLGHQSDIWYVGVYTPTAALGSFTLKSGHLPAENKLPDGALASESGLEPQRWKMFRFVVPAQIGGEDVLGWQLRMDSWSGPANNDYPRMVIRRDAVPSSASTVPSTWYPSYGRSDWPSGNQWSVNSDFTERTYSADGSQNYQSYGMWAAMGQPLEPGTYYVGIYNDSTTIPLNFTLSSKVVGPGMGIDLQPLTFDGGVAPISALAPREVAYYYTDIDPGTTSWQVSLGAAVGESALYIKKDFIPTIGNYSQPYYAAFESSGHVTQLRKSGDEHYTLLPDSGESEIPAGRYYLMVVSEGDSPTANNRVGANPSDATLTSHGQAASPQVLAPPVIGGPDIVHSDSYGIGQLKHYTFNIPSGANSVELELEALSGDPQVYVRYALGDSGLPAGGSYGYFSGYTANANDDQIITLNNPPAGTWRLTVLDPNAAASLTGGSYELRVRAIGELPLDFDGGTASVSSQSPQTWRFYKVDVPAQIGGENVLGWQLRMDSWSGPANNDYPRMVIRRDAVPSSASTVPSTWYPSYGRSDWPSGNQWSVNSDFTERTYSADGSQNYQSYGMWAAMGQPLEPGTYYVGVYNDSTTIPLNFTLSSKVVGPGMGIDLQPLTFDGGVAPISALDPREVAYYYTDIPSGTTSWQVSLGAAVGESSLYIKKDFIPTIGNYSQPTYAAFESSGHVTQLRKSGDEHYTLLPDSGETEIPAGRYYLMVVSEGDSPTANNRVGANPSDATLTSHGQAASPQVLAPPVIGGPDIVHSDSYGIGQLKHYTFNIPSGANSVELELEALSGDPQVYVRYALGDSGLPAGGSYGYFSGYTANANDDQIITLNNPPAGTWRLTVLDPNAAASLTGGSYVLRVRAIGELPLDFDGGTASVSSQSPQTWRFFKVDVPAQIGGEDVLGWQLRMDSWSGPANNDYPRMVIRRDAVPSSASTVPSTWYPSYGRSDWPSGNQWSVNSDFTERTYSADGSQNYQSYGMWAAMGQPLEPGTYYVGIYNDSTTIPLNFTLSSKVVGPGMGIDLQPLTFDGGVAPISALDPREVAYYYTDIPSGTTSWQVSLGAAVGESALYIKKDFIPTIGNYSQPTYAAFESSGHVTQLRKSGDEHYTLLPDSGETEIPAGRYYLMVVSEGDSPTANNRVGANPSNATLTSHGQAAIHSLGLIAVGASASQAESYPSGGVDLFEFEIPVGTPAFEVRLDNRIGNPEFAISSVNGQFPDGASYGHFSGGPNVPGSTRTMFANPAAGIYRLVVLDESTVANLASGSSTLVVTSVIPTVLNFSASLNGGGGTNTDSRILADDERAYYEGTVPATLGGNEVLGWKLDLEAVTGQPEIRVQPAALPNGANSNSGQTLNNWVSDTLIVVPPELTPGTWFVEVRGDGASDYTLTSEAVTLERGPWQMPADGVTPNTPGVSPPFFGDTGVNPAGVALSGDQGVDLANGDYHFYAFDVTEDNAALLRVQLEAISGNPDLYIRHSAIPTIDHTSPSFYTSTRSVLFDYRLDAASQTEYGNFVPFDGKNEIQLAPGRWYVSVHAGGTGNARYRMLLSTGNVADLSLDGGLATNQILAAGDWRYYKVEVPEDAPNNWTVGYTQTQGDVDLYIRDTIPPGEAVYKSPYGGATDQIKDWKSDNKTSGVEDNYPVAGNHTFSPPLIRPGTTYYLGFRANSDAIFGVSSAVTGGTIGPIPEIAFQEGPNSSININIPPGGNSSYKVIVPTNGKTWIHSSIRSGNIEIRIEQGSLPALTGVSHYSNSAANSGYTRALNAWPWVPGQPYYITFINHGGATENLQFFMMGEVHTDYAVWATGMGIPTDPASALLDNTGNGVPDIFDYALAPPASDPFDPRPWLVNLGDRIALRFILPENPCADVTLRVEHQVTLASGPWAPIATKIGDAAWSSTTTVDQLTLGDNTTQVTVHNIDGFGDEDTGFLRFALFFH